SGEDERREHAAAPRQERSAEQSGRQQREDPAENGRSAHARDRRPEGRETGAEHLEVQDSDAAAPSPLPEGNGIDPGGEVRDPGVQLDGGAHLRQVVDPEVTEGNQAEQPKKNSDGENGPPESEEAGSTNREGQRGAFPPSRRRDEQAQG